MQAEQHLFNRREIVVLLLDLDDATLHRTDLALPAPPTAAPTSSGATALDATVTAYVPPQTRLSVVREALTAFVAAKLRSAPNSSHMSFGLYAVRGDGAKAEDVVELSTPSNSGASSGRAVQSTLKSLEDGFYAYGAPSSEGDTQAYSGVFQLLRRLRDEAIAVQHQQQQVSSPSKTQSSAAWVGPSITRDGSVGAGDVATAAAGRGKGKMGSINGGGRGSTSSSSNNNNNSNNSNNNSAHACVMVHGIAVRSRARPSLSLASLSAAPIPSSTVNNEEAETCHQSSDSHLWLDIIDVDAAGQSGGDGSPASSSSCLVQGCHCALLDPVELTGVKHRGLALGPSLIRLMALPEVRGAAFVRRPLAFLKILRGSGTSVSGSDAGVASTLPGRLTLPTTLNTHERSINATAAAASPTSKSSSAAAAAAPAPSPRGRQAPQQADSLRGGAQGQGHVATTATATPSQHAPHTEAAADAVMPISSDNGSGGGGTRRRATAPAAALPTLSPTSHSRHVLSAGGTSGTHSSVHNGSGTAANTVMMDAHRRPSGAATLPAMTPRGLISPAASTHQQQQRRTSAAAEPKREKDASWTASRTSSVVEGEKTGEDARAAAAAAATFASGHRYATRSPDTTTTTTATTAATAAARQGDAGSNVPLRRTQRTPSGPATLSFNTPQRTPAADATPSVGVRSPVGTPATLRGHSSSPSSTTVSTGVAATMQAPLSSAAARQQQQQLLQQQQLAASAEQSVPALSHTLLQPQPPFHDRPVAALAARRVSDASQQPPQQQQQQQHPHATASALSAGIHRTSPPPAGAVRRRVSGPAQLHRAPSPTATAAGGGGGASHTRRTLAPASPATPHVKQPS